MSEFVYFAERQGLIKIGYSASPRTRVSSLKKSHLLGCLPGDRSTERELHKRFARFNKDREWFVDSPEIRAYILENTTLSGIPQGSIAVRISKTQYEAVRALARKRGVLISWLLTKAIARYLGDQKDGAQ